VNIQKATAIKWTALALLLVVQLVTVLLLTNTQRFYVEKEQLLRDPEFVGGEAIWKQKGKGFVQHNGSALAIVNEEIGYHAVYQTVPLERPGHYTVSFEAALSQVKGVAENYGNAEFFAVYRNELGAATGKGKKLFSATGTRSMAPYQQSFYMGSDVGSVDIMARLNNVSGKLTFSSPVLSRLQEFPLYQKVRAALVMLWLLIFAVFAYVVWRVYPRTQALALGGVLSIAVVGVLLPDSIISSAYGALQSVLPVTLIASIGNMLTGLFGYADLHQNAEVGKMGHFVVFLLIGIVAGLNFKKVGLVFSIASIAVFASLTEAMQLLVSGRTTSLNDFFIDVVAGVLGVGLGLAVVLFFGGDKAPRALASQ
jgi:VanZ family protein